MFSKLKNIYYILKWNRAIYTLSEFILWYFIWLYVFHIRFDLWYFIYISIIYLALFGLVYPIVYIFNDICDVDKDKLNTERLKYKPLAAWKISLNDFLAYWIIWIWLGLIIASFAPAVFMLFFGFAILFNFFYTKYLKHMFIIENFANGITHSFVRLLLGIILAIYSLWKICINYYHFSFFHLINIIIPKDITINYWKTIIITIILIVILHYIILSIWSTYKRYMEFISSKNARNTVSKYTLSTFKKIIWTLNIIYLIFFSVLLYIHFDWIILSVGILAILLGNLAILRKKSKKLDKILLRLFWW